MINEKVQLILDEINTASKEIPFGNSRFQNINFVLQGEITPARAYRHCLLRLNNRLNALKEAYYNLQLEDIDIEEISGTAPDLKAKVKFDMYGEKILLLKYAKMRLEQ